MGTISLLGCGIVSSVAATPFTWDSATADPTLTFANSNRDITGESASGHASARTTAGKTSGLWYCEITIQSTPIAQPPVMIGICNQTASMTAQFIGSTASGGSYGWNYQTSFSNGFTVANAIPSTQNLATNDIIQIAMNLSNGKMWLGQNNTWKTGSPAADTFPWQTFTVGSDTWYFAATQNFTPNNPTIRLASSLAFTPPAGFTGINA